MCGIHFRSLWTCTPSNLKALTLSLYLTISYSNWFRELKLLWFPKTDPHLLGLFRIYLHVISYHPRLQITHFYLHVTITTARHWLILAAVISEFTGAETPGGQQSSTSLTNTLNRAGEITPPCGTPAITSPLLETTPGSFTCSVCSLFEAIWQITNLCQKEKWTQGFHKILFSNQIVYHSPGMFASNPLSRKQED